MVYTEILYLRVNMQEFGQYYMVARHEGFRRVEAWTIVSSYSRVLSEVPMLLLRTDVVVK